MALLIETDWMGYGFMATRTSVVAWESVCEELIALQSIYCREGECEIVAPPGLTFESLEDYRSPEDIEVKLKLVLEPNTRNCICSPNSFQVLASITLPQFYPCCAYPTVSVSSKHLSSKELYEIDDKAIKFMKSNSGNYCLFTLLEYVKEELKQIASTCECTIGCDQSSIVSRHEFTSSQKQTEDKTQVLIAHLDHMRNQSKYFKALHLWGMQLHISGIVLNAGVHAIYVVLTGRPGNLREFVKRWRTQSIDVDSQGCPCKERMMSIICQESIGITTPNL